MRRPKDKIPEERGEWWQRMLWPGRLYSRRTPYAAQCATRLVRPAGHGEGRREVGRLLVPSSQKEPLSESVGLRLMARRALLDFLDGGRNVWGSILRVMKFQMHAPANEMQFEH